MIIVTQMLHSAKGIEFSNQLASVVTLSNNIRAPTMWQFDKGRLRRACAAPFKMMFSQ